MTRRTDNLADRSLKLLRRARDVEGYYAESLATDYAIAALVLDEVDEAEARRAVQKAWDEHFKAWGAV